MLRPGEKRMRSSIWTRRPRRPALLAVGLAISLGGCTFLLDFDDPVEPVDDDAGADASTVDAGDTPDAADVVDASTALNCTAFEPNDSLAEASAITPSSIDAAICPDADGDFYSFALLADTNLTVTLTFDNATSDLNLQLYNSADTVVAAAVGTDATEQILRGPAQGNALPAGTYRIEVLSATGDSTIDYNLTLAVATAAAAQ